jgi:TfoX/Sxy family transcriptional regulator of competence genes
MTMASEELSDRIRNALGHLPISEKKMFGARAFMMNGNMVVATFRDGSLLVRVGKEGVDEALALPGTSRMEMGERTMGGFVVVSGDALEDDAELSAWLERGRAVAASLPPK